MPETLEGKRETDKMRAHSYFSMADAAKTAVPHTGCMQGHEEAGRKKKKADGKQEKMVETSLQQLWKQPHLMAAAIQQTVYSLSLSPSLSRSLLFALCRRKSGGVGVGGRGLSLVLGVGLDCWREWSFFSSGVKGGRSCVQSSWQKALLCAAYADRGGSFVHRWRSHAWVCLRRRAKGGRRGEKSVGRRGSAITVSGGGRGRRKGEPSRPGSSQVVRRGHKSKRILITANLQMRSQTDSHLLSKKLAAPQHHGQ